MSPRRSRRKDPFARDGRGGRGGSGRPPSSRPVGTFVAGVDQVEEWPDGDWHVRRVTGAGTDKTYRCPGCDQEIRSGVPHLVSWPAWTGGEEERRHWHTACWRHRTRRGPGRTRY
ncbi:ATP/GTP-binding protein [Streptosporangium sp. NPDC048047]|uniref:ATP/GTP-binding protein n=1 Tax=Streptosporangium sp. NPDC048047 TaxID=3155748 RepID=UPI00341C77E1